MPVEFSAVIPTVLRNDLGPAIASARQQSVACEVVLGVDRDEPSLTPAERQMLADADRVVFTGGSQGAAMARNSATAASTGVYVAYLDDDDSWLPGKLEQQLATLSADPTALSTGRIRQRRFDATTLSDVRPAHTIGAGDRVEDYLFRRRRPSPARAGIQTSTFALSRAAALDVGWDPTLPRHQDWDFLIRAQRAGMRVVMAPDAYAVVAVGSPGSISASADWRSSLDWADRWRADWDPGTWVDFVVAQPLRYALHRRSREGVRECLRRVRDVHRVPSLGPVVIATAGLAPRRTVERLLTRGRASSTT